MLILVLGGSGSGKSAFAEALTMSFGGTRAYIATMEPFGEEGRRRIERHRLMRKDKGFETVESFYDITPALGFDNALLECLTNLAANRMFSKKDENAFENIMSQLEKFSKYHKNTVIVSGDIFCDGGNYDEYTLKYMELVGRLNCELAQRADAVYEVVCGLPLPLKGEK